MWSWSYDHVTARRCEVLFNEQMSMLSLMPQVGERANEGPSKARLCRYFDVMNDMAFGDAVRRVS